MKASIKTLILIPLVVVIGYIFKVQLQKPEETASTRVHLVLPIEHQALRDIVKGFEKSLSSAFPEKVSYKVHNAQGDINLQRSILQKLSSESVDLIVPIGTNTTQMTLKLIPNKPILSLAAMYTEEYRKNHLITGVLDEIDSSQFISFLKNIHSPHARIVIIHSTDDRRVKEGQQMEVSLKNQNFIVKRFMIQTLNDLYTVGQSLPAGTQSVVILKDHLVVSGISALKKMCDEKKIALITSDEGTIKSGASLGFGVTEKDIGIEGGKLAVQILKGEPIQNIPIRRLRDLKVFANNDFLEKNPSMQIALEKLCQRNPYQLVNVQPEALK